jgi:hypothetical protein
MRQEQMLPLEAPIAAIKIWVTASKRGMKRTQYPKQNPVALLQHVGRPCSRQVLFPCWYSIIAYDSGVSFSSVQLLLMH